jgi:transposase-like protein
VLKESEVGAATKELCRRHGISEQTFYRWKEKYGARLEPHPDATMLLTAVSEAVERYDPSREAAILLEVASGYQVLILSPEGYEYVGGLTFEGYGILGPARG